MSGIRMADIPDVQRIYELGLELLEQSSYAGIKPDEQKFKTLVAGLIGDKAGWVYVVVDDHNQVQGFFMGMIDEWFFSRSRYATDMAIYIRSGFRQFAPRLYKMFIKWAKSKPRVVSVSFAQSSGMGDPNRWNKLMNRLGLDHVGGIYTMRVTPCQV